MRAFGILLLLAALTAGQGGITGGKAKKLVEKALPLLKKADETFKAWVLETVPKEELKDRLGEAVKLYDRGTGLLQDALDIQYDAGVNHRSKIAARRLQKMRYYLEFQLKRRPKPRPKPPPASPDAPKKQPDPMKEPDPPPPPPPSRDLTEDERPVAAVSFAANEPPGKPRDTKLAPIPGIGETAEQQRFAKADRRLIGNLLSAYYGALKKGKLRGRHRLCRGKGVLGADSCEECCGTGEEVNLHHFRKAYWSTYTPLLRDAGGALDALNAYYERVRRDPTLLPDPVKTFK
ncbi:MAG: hypothetical protein OER88_08480, partial [Planctomycetota bacterium]|nr:hypothetical protein [Planctomycetota bacterium]